MTETHDFSATSVQSFSCQRVGAKLDWELLLTCWLRCRNAIPSAAFWHWVVTSGRCQSTAGSAAIENAPESICQMLMSSPAFSCVNLGPCQVGSWREKQKQRDCQEILVFFSAAEPRAASTLGIMQHLCQTPPNFDPRAQGKRASLHLLELPDPGPSKADEGKNKQWKFPALNAGAELVPGSVREGLAVSCSTCWWTLPSYHSLSCHSSL